MKSRDSGLDSRRDSRRNSYRDSRLTDTVTRAVAPLRHGGVRTSVGASEAERVRSREHAPRAATRRRGSAPCASFGEEKSAPRDSRVASLGQAGRGAEPRGAAALARFRWAQATGRDRAACRHTARGRSALVHRGRWFGPGGSSPLACFFKRVAKNTRICSSLTKHFLQIKRNKDQLWVQHMFYFINRPRGLRPDGQDLRPPRHSLLSTEIPPSQATRRRLLPA